MNVEARRAADARSPIPHGRRPSFAPPAVQVQMPATSSGKEQSGVYARGGRAWRLSEAHSGSGTALSEPSCFP